MESGETVRFRLETAMKIRFGFRKSAPNQWVPSPTTGTMLCNIGPVFIPRIFPRLSEKN